MPPRPLALFLLAVVCVAASADDKLDRLDKARQGLLDKYTSTISDWRFTRPDTEGLQQPSVDESSWQAVSPGFKWQGENTKVWFRTRLIIPAKINGEPVEGLPVRLELGVDDDGELYIDGRLREAFHWDDCVYTLTPHAHAGEVYQLAVRGINEGGDGELRHARVVYDVFPELGQFLTEAKFVLDLKDHVSAADRARLRSALADAEGQIQFETLDQANLGEARHEVALARHALQPIAAITRSQDVYYVGHAHIDMNWLWPWPETIDVCRRTWNSAMNLMDDFPDFCFVQSQPGAYAAIKADYPAEFERMISHEHRGQWDLVGGLWNESDTDMPSGEGLAMSFLTGQRFFKDNFGSYATTGWLPDSFGHSWQLPQLMRLSGIDNFYHMRCGNGMPFTWWESPDGSRVLKANTEPYNANVEPGQLTEPADNLQRYGLPKSLVVFGVGDHGGGPTREQILTAEAYKQDPILPKVHLVSADAFFKTLRASSAAQSLPVVDTDLQYVFTGCYTTHADIKKAVRDSENGLYTAQVLSSMASMIGNPYPVRAFDEAWKPTVFAQFHDIMCGSAIHSTYDWMHGLLNPALQFEQEQTQSALHVLTAHADTRGPGSQAIVVWNPLSFFRNDIVRVKMAHAARYQSVVDRAGHRFAAQADGDNLVFVARSVPAFGHATYFPSTGAAHSDGVTFSRSGVHVDVETPIFHARVDGYTGALSDLVMKAGGWHVLADTPLVPSTGASDGNMFELLGDNGSAWDFGYTGAEYRPNDGDVSIVAIGPVFVRVRVVHRRGPSTYTQDLTFYGALDRIDIPTTVDWHDHSMAAKIRIPVNVQQPAVRVEIPYGSINRPTNGQECSGQKWMEVDDVAQFSAKDPQPVALAGYFNSNSSQSFDTEGRSFPLGLAPVTRGVVRHGPFRLEVGPDSQPDNISSSGQRIPLNVDGRGRTLYLLAACNNGGRSTWLGTVTAGRGLERRCFNLNDWVVASYPDNELWMSFPYRIYQGRHEAYQPKLWMVGIPLPAGRVSALVLPDDPQVHIFAMSVATAVAPKAVRGLTVLNDCKYGFDCQGNMFRLTALRSSRDPDPNPDEGLQHFTYSLYPHEGDWREARAEEHGLGLNIPLLAELATPHPGVGDLPSVSIQSLDGKGDVVVGGLKHAEDEPGYILRVYESQGRDVRVKLRFRMPADGAVQGTKVDETDILERPMKRHLIVVTGDSATLSIGHDQIVTLHIRQRR